MKIAEFKNLYVSYEDDDVLKNISLDIDEFEHTAILGANGSGKSTLIKLFSNDIYPRIMQGSSKMLFGKERWSIFELKNYLGIITNDLHYYLQNYMPHITGYDATISSFHSAIGIYEHHQYTALHHDTTIKTFEQLGILELSKKPLGEMSTGELRKFVIARALVHNPKALLLDEPTVGLDIKAQIDFISMLKSLAKHKTIILITHHIEEIFSEINKIVLLKDGQIIAQGHKDDILASKNISHTFGIELEIDKVSDRYNYKIKGK